MSRRKDNVDFFRRCLPLQRIKRTAIGVLNSYTPEDLPCEKCETEKKQNKTKNLFR